MGPRWVASGRGVEVVTLATSGLDGLLPYFVRYLPALVSAATITPLALLLVLDLDLTSAIIALVTLPLVPIFMVLIGRMTQARSARQLAAMQGLRGRVLDLISGLPTLRALGRSRGPADRVRELGDAHRRATMGSLRVAFLSGLVLELAHDALGRAHRRVDGFPARRGRHRHRDGARGADPRARGVPPAAQRGLALSRGFRTASRPPTRCSPTSRSPLPAEASGRARAEPRGPYPRGPRPRHRDARRLDARALGPHLLGVARRSRRRSSARTARASRRPSWRSPGLLPPSRGAVRSRPPGPRPR